MAVDLTQLIDFNLLKRYDTNLKVWVEEAINGAGELVFAAEMADLPSVGNGHTLYIVGTELYSWDGAQYVKLSGGNINTSTVSYLVNVPVGAIVIWSGTIDNIPSNWALCDGQDGRPDLRNKFVVGAGDRYNVNDIGAEIATSEGITNTPSYYSLCYIIKTQNDETGNINFGELPATGNKNTLYVTDGKLEIWNPDTNNYDVVGGESSIWDTF